MLKRVDSFTKSIIVVFTGTTIVNFLNLLYQLIIAHKLAAHEFASFNSLLAIFIIISAPSVTMQLAITKYCAEFNAHNQDVKIKSFLSGLFKKCLVLTSITFLFFLLFSSHILSALKIDSFASGYILAALLATTWIYSVFIGAAQGLELFGWFSSISLVAGVLKLFLAFLFILLGYGIAGALGAFLTANIAVIVMFYFILGKNISFAHLHQGLDYYKEFFGYLLPIAVSWLCFMTLVNSDMILVKYFFPADNSGKYSLAQMVGKIFLFLPLAVSTVMFPKTTGLNSKNMGTSAILNKSFLYISALCIIASAFYNIFPNFVMNILTGKANPESVFLGRLFGISMSFFAVLYMLILYFISVKDMRFIKYLALGAIFQVMAIAIFHKSLIQVQEILCINAIVLVLISLLLAYKKGNILAKIDRAA